MGTNPILDEIYATREKLLAEHGGDLHAYVESARKRALESGRPIYQPERQDNDRPKSVNQPKPDENSASPTN